MIKNPINRMLIFEMGKKLIDFEEIELKDVYSLCEDYIVGLLRCLR